MSDSRDIHIGIIRHNMAAMLTGNVKQVEELLKQNDSNPIPIATIRWEGVETQVNSYLFAYVLYDAFRFERRYDLFASRHIQELLDLHKRVCSPMPRPDYSKFNFLTEIGEIYSFDDDSEVQMLLNDGASQQDICLTNFGLTYHEEELICLLKSGASPYFLNRTMLDEEMKNGGYYFHYNEVAPLMDRQDTEISDQWDLDGLDAILDETSLPHSKYLDDILFSVFSVAASYRILYLVDKYITPEAREKGKLLMKKYCNHEYSILD